MVTISVMRIFPACILASALTLAAQEDTATLNHPLVRAYLWPKTVAEFDAAAARLEQIEGIDDLDRGRLHDLEEWMRLGRGDYPPAPAAVDGQFPLQRLNIAVGGGLEIPVFVKLPSRYDHRGQWPLMFAMHGGPPSQPNRVERSAQRMINVWKQPAERAGWIVASPSMTTTLTAAGRTRERLPYEIFQPEIARAVIDHLRTLYNIDSNRIVSTGISLGSNFSIAYGAAHPDWLSAIVPVSTEGDSREHLLRNLMTVPTYVLEGSQDKNIRGVGGPRAFDAILTQFGYDLNYREFSDRSHEGFQEHYADVLRWCNERPRALYPREILRVPHSAIVPISRRVHWIESDTRQGLLWAKVSGPQRIDITGRWARRAKIYLHDRLINLDQPFEVWINGLRVYRGQVSRSARTALAQARALGDARRIYVAELDLELPTGQRARNAREGLWQHLVPKHAEGQLSFWEMYAIRALQERFPGTGIKAHQVDLADPITPSPEQVGMQIDSIEKHSPLAEIDLRPGDVLVEFAGEPFYRDHGGIDGLDSWLLRELRATPRTYTLKVVRDQELLDLELPLQLGPYQPR